MPGVRGARDPLPRPLLALAVVVVLAAASGAWLNDDGPWSSAAPPTASAPAPSPVVTQPAPDVGVSTGFAILESELLGTDVYYGPDGAPGLSGYCAFHQPAHGSTLTVYWHGVVPPSVLGRVSSGSIPVTLRFVQVPHSRADVTAAMRALRRRTTVGGHTYAAVPRSPGVPAGLKVEDVERGRHCGSVGVDYAYRDGREPPRSVATPEAVARALETRTAGVPVMARAADYRTTPYGVALASTCATPVKGRPGVCDITADRGLVLTDHAGRGRRAPTAP